METLGNSTSKIRALSLPPGGVKRFRSSLALALILLPRRSREDAFLFHDFCRAVDDIADGDNLNLSEKQILLDAWLHALQPGAEPCLPYSFREMVYRRQLDRHLLSEIVRGMRMDTEQNRYERFESLHVYCWRVASAVGITCARIFGADGTAVERYAEELGIALQLTNILRDVSEDACMGRIYLPLEDLHRFGVSEDEILKLSPSPAATHLFNHHAERADSFFAKAEVAWSNMTANQRRLMKPARLMSAIYRDLLLQMHRERYDVFHYRYRVSALKKVLLASMMAMRAG